MALPRAGKSVQEPHDSPMYISFTYKLHLLYPLWDQMQQWNSNTYVYSFYSGWRAFTYNSHYVFSFHSLQGQEPSFRQVGVPGTSDMVSCNTNVIGGGTQAYPHSLQGRMEGDALFLASADLVHIIPRQPCLCMLRQHSICIFHFPPETGAVVSATPGSLQRPVEGRLRGRNALGFRQKKALLSAWSTNILLRREGDDGACPEDLAKVGDIFDGTIGGTTGN